MQETGDCQSSLRKKALTKPMEIVIFERANRIKQTLVPAMGWESFL